MEARGDNLTRHILFCPHPTSITVCGCFSAQKEKQLSKVGASGGRKEGGESHPGSVAALRWHQHDRKLKPKRDTREQHSSNHPALLAPTDIDGAVAPGSRHHLRLHFLINALPNFPWLPALPLSVTLLIMNVSLHRGKQEEKLFFQGDS